MDFVAQLASVDTVHLAEILAVNAYAWLWKAGLIHTEVKR